jgi:hypothetical protein
MNDVNGKTMKRSVASEVILIMNRNTVILHSNYKATKT